MKETTIKLPPWECGEKTIQTYFPSFSERRRTLRWQWNKLPAHVDWEAYVMHQSLISNALSNGYNAHLKPITENHEKFPTVTAYMVDGVLRYTNDTTVPHMDFPTKNEDHIKEFLSGYYLVDIGIPLDFKELTPSNIRIISVS